MDSLTFERYEDEMQAKFGSIELQFKPLGVITVTLLRFKNVSVGTWSDRIDTPDPQFYITCEKVTDPHLKTFRTRNISSNITEGEINEVFKFVIPDHVGDDESFPMKIGLVDQDLLFDDLIGVRYVETSSIPLDGKPTLLHLKFGENGEHGDLDLIIQKSTRNTPDFRFALDLCSEERKFRKKRIPFAQKAITELLGSHQAPRNATETPVVSLVGSGGGYRAMVGMCGAMEALRDAQLLDAITYNCGLSGSGWYLAAAYGLEGVGPFELEAFHEELRTRFQSNLFWDLVNPRTIASYESYADVTLEKYKLPQTFVNYFPGFLVGKQTLGQTKHQITLSELSPYIQNGKVPYPIIVALHVRNKTAANKFHAYVERSPHEVYFPSFGLGIDPKDEGCLWSNGIITRVCPEYPLHFTVGMTGCAFAILLNQFFKFGDETGINLENLIDRIRIEDKEKANKDLDSTERVAEIESEDDDDDESDNEDSSDDTNESKPLSPSPADRNDDQDEDADEDEDNASSRSRGSARRFNHRAARADSSIAIAAMGAFTTMASTKKSVVDDMPRIAKTLRHTKFFTSRNACVGRTARLHNFALNVNPPARYNLDPFTKNIQLDEQQKEVIKAVGHRANLGQLSAKQKTLAFVDAGILKNVPTDAVLRPQRGTDVMIVMDFNNYHSDDTFDYKPLIAAAAHSWQSGLKFPKIDLETIVKLPPKEFLVFPSDADDCPTVLWFTLSNKKFKELKDYKPRSTEKPPREFKDKPFNDFPVFGDGSFSSTFRFHYKKYHFDQIRELMYYNVISHVEDIKKALVEATERRRRRINKR